jgi:hypothetical protein
MFGNAEFYYNSKAAAPASLVGFEPAYEGKWLGIQLMPVA